MRFRIVAKRYKQPVQYLVRLGDGKVVRWPQNAVQRHLGVGSTGTIVQGRKGERLVPDAIDA